MQSKTSWFNNQILLQGFRVAGWIGIIYTIGLFFVLPLSLIMISTSDFPEDYYADVNSIFHFTELAGVLTIVIPILVAIFTLRYLQIKSSSDLYHSLPVKRGTLYINFITVGALMVTIPVIVSGLILVFLHPLLDLQLYFEFQDIFLWVGISLLLNLFIYVSAVFVGMLTGNSMIQGVLSYIFLLFIVGVTILVSMNLDLLLFGYKANYVLDNELERLSPLIRIFKLRNIPFTALEALFYAAMTILLATAALFVYKMRKQEVVSNPIAFPFLKPIFKYGVTFFMMLTGGFYFTIMGGKLGWIIFGYIIGSIIGYLVAEMVLQKTWRIIGTINFKGIIFYGLFATGLILLINTDVFGYEDRIPDKSEIKRVYFNNHGHSYINVNEDPTQFFENEKNIDSIIALHEKIVKERFEPEANQPGVSAFFAYELKNGRRIIREYTIPLNEDYESYLRPIYESEEFKKVYYMAMQINPENVESISFSPRGAGGKTVIIHDESEITDLLTYLKEDIKNETYEETNNGQGQVSDMIIKLKEKNTNDRFEAHYETYHSIRASYTQVLKWLKDHGKYEDAILTDDEIDYILVSENDELERELYTIPSEEMEKKLMNDSATEKYTEKEKINLAIKYASEFYEGNNSRYIVAIKYKKDNYIELRGLNEKNYNSLVAN